MSVSRMIIALTIVATLLFGIHYYLWARLVRDPALPPPWGMALTWALIVLGASGLGGFVLARLAPRSVSSPVMWVVYTWLGLMFFLLVLVTLGDIARGLGGIVRLIGGGQLDPERRLAIARFTAGAVGAIGVALGGVALANGLAEVAIKRVKIALPKLPASDRPYNLVQLTDIHVGPTIGEAFIRDLVTRVNALEPDAIVITGDLVDGSVAALGPLVAPLAGLRARDGVYFVTGNHEYYSGVDEWLAFLGTLGIRVLRNEHLQVGPFDLAGVDDWTAHSFGHGHGADLPRAVKGHDESRPLILLAHQPQAIVEAETLGVDLQLSGHTHGGQIFPFKYLVGLLSP
jgi:predicted MPP superfamily phosphohydrolase